MTTFVMARRLDIGMRRAPRGAIKEANRMDYTFTIGAPVRVREGEAGRLKFVVVDPRDDEVTDLIVERGRLLRRPVVVPVGWVKRADENAIELNASLDDLEDVPEYREIEFQVPDPAFVKSGYSPEQVRMWATPAGLAVTPIVPLISRRVRLGVDDDAVLIGRGTDVKTKDGRTVGTVDHLLADAKTNEVTHLVVHPRFHLGHDEDVIIGLDSVASLGDGNVYLRATEEELKRAPRYRPAATDKQLEKRVARALETQPATRDSGLRAEVDRGIVRLVGDVPEKVSRAASDLVRRIRGVIGVEDRTKHPT
jgi:sporulation protein YlmC with PRC-barrel domain